MSFNYLTTEYKQAKINVGKTVIDHVRWLMKFNSLNFTNVSREDYQTICNELYVFLYPCQTYIEDLTNESIVEESHKIIRRFAIQVKNGKRLIVPYTTNYEFWLNNGYLDNHRIPNQERFNYRLCCVLTKINKPLSICITCWNLFINTYKNAEKCKGCRKKSGKATGFKYAM